jgi:2-polyprenyl-6-hydroxyphenyl methylase/3-demethylubiquinone-9 3-methyltransferase
MGDGLRFAFGKNWRSYASHVGDAQLQAARESIRAFLGEDVKRLQGARVLDVGCGSGLFCAAMAGLGVKSVVGVDVDPACVETSRALLRRLVPDADVTLHHASILDRAFVEGLGSFDLVYAWGSLHHTGELWHAVENAAGRVAPGGMLWMALYNKTRMSGPWTHVKRFYNLAPAPGRLAMTAAWFGLRAAVRAARRKPVFSVERGMDLWHDAADWLGGYPYEASTPWEVLAFMERLGTTLVRQQLTHTLGCNEFLFQRPA